MRHAAAGRNTPSGVCWATRARTGELGAIWGGGSEKAYFARHGPPVRLGIRRIGRSGPASRRLPCYPRLGARGGGGRKPKRQAVEGHSGLDNH